MAINSFSISKSDLALFLIYPEMVGTHKAIDEDALSTVEVEPAIVAGVLILLAAIVPKICTAIVPIAP